MLTGCSKSGSESLEVEPKSGEYHRVYTDSAGEPHLMKQSVRLEFKRNGFEKDSFQIGLAKARRSQEYFIYSEDPAELLIDGDRLTLTSNVYHPTTGVPEVYVFRIISENELEFIAAESKDIYHDDPALINLEDGMRFRIPEKGEAIIDSADTVLPEKKKT